MTAVLAEWLFITISKTFTTWWSGHASRMPPGHFRGKKRTRPGRKGSFRFLRWVQENKPFILNVYRCVSREQIENYLFSLTYSLIAGVVEEQAEGMDVPKEEREFIAHFYKYSFVGVMLDWIRRGMKEEPRELAEKICITMHGNIIHSLENAEAAAKGELKIFQ